MKKTIKIQTEIPQTFSLQLDRYILKLKEKGVEPIPTKAQLIAEYALEGFKLSMK